MKIKPYNLIVAVALVIAGVTLISMQERPQPGNPINLGFVGPLTGGPALWGEGARNMVQLATEEINQSGGIKGRPLNITYEDGKCTPAGSVAATQKLLRDGVKVILGGHCSPETAGMVPLSKDGSFFMLAGITSADNVMADSEFAYRTSPPTKDFTVQLSQEVIKKYKKVATITEQAAFSKSYTIDFVADFKAKGGEIIAQEEYKPEQTDFRNELSRLKVVGAEAIFISPQSPTTAITIVKQMQELQMAMPIFGNSILVTKDVYEKSGKSSLFNSAFAIIPYTDTSNADAKKLTEKYKAQFSQEVPYNYFYVSASYDATYMVANGLKRCAEDTKCLSDYFKKLKYKGVSSDYAFKDNGDSTFDSWAKITINAKGEEIIQPL